MSTESTNFGYSSDPFAMGGMTVFYALTPVSIQQIESGVFKSTSGENLQMRRITSEMMKGNQGLIAEIHALALAGHLGFTSQGNNNIRFRSDVAEKIGNTRNFQTFTLVHPENTEEFTAEISGVDATEYSNLTEQFISLEEEAELEKKHKHNKIDEAQLTHLAPPPKREKVLPNQQKAVRQLAESMLQQTEINQEKHRNHAAEVRREEAKVEREEVKRETLKREIKNSEIAKTEKNASDKRQELNVGEEIDVSANRPKGVPPKPFEKVKKRKLN